MILNFFTYLLIGIQQIGNEFSGCQISVFVDFYGCSDFYKLIEATTYFSNAGVVGVITIEYKRVAFIAVLISDIETGLYLRMMDIHFATESADLMTKPILSSG